MSDRTWCYSGDGEKFQGECATREEALAEAAREEVSDPGSSFWIGRSIAPAFGLDMDAGDVLDRLHVQANDDTPGDNDFAEDWPPEDLKPDAAAQLDAIVERFNEQVREWFWTHCAPTWWGVEDSEEWIMPTDPGAAAERAPEKAAAK